MVKNKLVKMISPVAKWATTFERSKDVKSRRRFLQTGLKVLVGATLVGEAGIHANYYLGNNWDTEVREKFKELYGVDVHVFKEDTENASFDLVTLSEALRLHQVLNEGTEFKGLKSITVDNSKFYNRNLAGQLRCFHSLD